MYHVLLLYQRATVALEQQILAQIFVPVLPLCSLRGNRYA